MLKRVTSLLLCALLVLSAAFLVACKDDGEASGSNAEVGDLAGFKPEKKDWGGETVNILGYRDTSRVYSQCQIDVEETNGESVNDAFYKRNELIKSNFGIDIQLVLPDEGEDTIKVLQDDMLAGTNEIDAVVTGLQYIAPLGISGDLVDLNGSNIKYLNLGESWWDQNLTRDLDINGRCYLITGDALVNDDEATRVMFFNKGIATTYGLEDIYDVVKDGKWTMDKMYEMADTVANDQAKVWDVNTDSLYGMVSQAYDILSFMHGFDQPIVDNTGDEPFLRVGASENQTAFLAIQEKLMDKLVVGFADFDGVFTGDWDALYGSQTKIFANGKALFMPNGINLVNSSDLRDTEISFGIIPMPKLNDSQDKYITSVTVYGCDVFAVPKSNEAKLDVTCYALEAMAYFGQKYVTEEYYTRTVSLKRLKDERDSEMLDLVFDNKMYDMGCVFNFGQTASASGSLYFYSEVLKDGNIASHWQTKESVYQGGLDDLIGQAYYG